MNSNRKLDSVRKWCSRLVGMLCLVSVALWNAAAAQAADGPSIVKPRVFAGVYQNWKTWSPTTKKWQENYTSWMPSLRFTVLGPVEAGSQFIVEFTKPNGQLWWSLPCETEEIKAGDWGRTSTPRDTSTANEKKYVNGTGIFGFKIRLKNELTSMNKVLYSGKFKVGKVSKFNGTPVTKNQYDFFVDHDWALPFSYFWFEEDNVIKSSQLKSTMWFKGGVSGSGLAAYVLHNGKTIGSTKDQGSASTTREAVRTERGDKNDPIWELVEMEWYNIARTALDPENPNDKVFYLDKNPGEYEIKVLRGGKLCRQTKFTVGADGKIVENKLNAADNLNTDVMVFPVKVVGTTDGKWNPLAWKTEAFYGNPVKGFTAP